MAASASQTRLKTSRRRVQRRVQTAAVEAEGQHQVAQLLPGRDVGQRDGDRVIYRELFPFGLTVADLSNDIRPVAVSLAHVAARQELRNLMLALGLDGGRLDAPLDAAA